MGTRIEMPGFPWSCSARLFGRWMSNPAQKPIVAIGRLHNDREVPIWYADWTFQVLIGYPRSVLKKMSKSLARWFPERGFPERWFNARWFNARWFNARKSRRINQWSCVAFYSNPSKTNQVLLRSSKEFLCYSVWS